jgi:hypothetical protein
MQNITNTDVDYRNINSAPVKWRLAPMPLKAAAAFGSQAAIVGQGHHRNFAFIDAGGWRRQILADWFVLSVCPQSL